MKYTKWNVIKVFSLGLIASLLWDSDSQAGRLRLIDAKNVSWTDRKDNITGLNNRERDLTDNGKTLENQIDDSVGSKPWASSSGPGNGKNFVFNVGSSASARGRTEYWFYGKRTNPDTNSSPSGPNNASTKIKWGEVRWTGFTFRIPNWHTSYFGSNAIMMQYYQYSPAGPPVDFAYGQSGNNVRVSLKVFGSRKGSFTITSSNRNKWYDVVCTHKFGTRSSDGAYFNADYKKNDDSNYSQLVRYSGITGYNSRRSDGGLWQKVGIYRPNTNSTTSRLEYDFVSVGTSRNDIDPAVIY